MRKVKINRDGSITIKRVVTTTIQPKRVIFREVENPCEDCEYKYECKIERLSRLFNNCF
jgi:hypothetical protein